MSRRSWVFLGLIVVVALLAIVFQVMIHPKYRDPLKQPFAQTSIWNTPIGSKARYVPAGFQPAQWATVDEDYFFVLSAKDPLRPVYRPAAWNHRAGGTSSQDLELPLADTLFVPDADDHHTPNNAAALLLPDGRTLIQVNPFTRCERGGPAYGWQAPTEDLYGSGVSGGHGGSGLSSIGGTIRHGELVNPEPIQHVLKVNIFCQRYAHFDSCGFRWPATCHDAGADTMYHGVCSAVRLGSLLAIPPAVQLDDLHLQTAAAKKIFWTLQNFGAYVADNTAWDAYALCVEHGVGAEFHDHYGYSIEGETGPWHDDVMKLFGAMAVVDNNGPYSLGGGGRPRTPRPLPLRTVTTNSTLIP